MTGLGGMGREASECYSRLSESIAEKRKERYSGIKIRCFCMCVRGRRSVYPLRDTDLENDSRTSEIQVHMS